MTILAFISLSKRVLPTGCFAIAKAVMPVRRWSEYQEKGGNGGE
jgi:hypothetical protein